MEENQINFIKQAEKKSKPNVKKDGNHGYLRKKLRCHYACVVFL